MRRQRWRQHIHLSFIYKYEVVSRGAVVFPEGDVTKGVLLTVALHKGVVESVGELYSVLDVSCNVESHQTNLHQPWRGRKVKRDDAEERGEWLLGVRSRPLSAYRKHFGIVR